MGLAGAEAFLAFRLLAAEGDAVLSTISVAVEGYPFGSITPYCLDSAFRPNILISSLAQHTKNILTNPKVSMTIVEDNPRTNKQAQGRLTYIGDAVRVEEDAYIRKRYLHYFPNAASYFETHDFAFYAIQPKRLRFIGGFGDIHWVESDAMADENIFALDVETGIVEHMNADHDHNLRDYLRAFLSIEISNDDPVRMAGIDQYGIDIFHQERKFRIEFSEPLEDPSDARAKLVELAKQARN